MNQEIIPVSKASFVLAFCEANQHAPANAALNVWANLHDRDSFSDGWDDGFAYEIDEDP